MRFVHRAAGPELPPPRAPRIPRPARGWGESAAGQVGHRVRCRVGRHFEANPMPFDGERMIYGGFEVIVDA